VTGLEINILEVDFCVDGQGLHFIRVGRWFGSELERFFVAHYWFCDLILWMLWMIKDLLQDDMENYYCDNYKWLSYYYKQI
jgi:hypothetical protein